MYIQELEIGLCVCVLKLFWLAKFNNYVSKYYAVIALEHIFCHLKAPYIMLYLHSEVIIVDCVITALYNII